MKVYHGCQIDNLPKLLTGKSNRFGGLYVTCSFELAARYANAQASRTVDPAAISLVAERATVVEIETTEEVNWRKRPADHNSLDICEDSIENWTVKAVHVKLPEYWNSCVFSNNKHIPVSEFIDTLNCKVIKY